MSENGKEVEKEERISERDRWVAAVSYIPFLCFFSLWRSRDSSFVKFHASQGFLLFLAECVAIVLIVIFEFTIGRLRFMGIFLVGLFQLGTSLLALLMAVIGFVKALFGEYWHMPVFGDYRERIPGFHGE